MSGEDLAFGIAGLVILAMGFIFGFAISDWVHEKVLKGFSAENSRLWAEIRRLEGEKWE